MQDELSLVSQAQQGNKEAFAQLYENYFNKIYRYVVLKMGNRTEAEDVTQQVFLKALKSIYSFKWRGTPFSAWLFRIAHNLVVDHLRKSSKVVMTPLYESLPSSDGNPFLITESRLDIERLRSATKQLTKAQQEVISLRFAADLSVAETAKAIGKSEGAVKALQHSATVALRKVLLVGQEQ
ncbi:MAG: sigma-70 family RNA polymerase sigma factor [Chloroflexota bacterium]|nr:sigma-70 family RNA polymerase sigma factor [Chloroflexota bacterium]